MKQILSNQTITYPENVTIVIRSRVIRVTGPRGTLTRKFLDISMDIKHDKAKRTITVAMWFGKKKVTSQIRTVCSHIQNMVTGVTQGFRYKMRFVSAHFPINANIPDTHDFIDIRNFLGEKIVRTVKMHEGVQIFRSTAQKDEIILEGNNIENVAQTCARIHQVCLVHNKDIRKFLDGIYVSEKGAIPVAED